ncbi:unnamed protein product [Adineta ricciae]|uniref:Uncharacterized protein n=1 Tax=Adineta ricciae TaxID=249248 RepID=A0A814S135_ADIRI|nr:unnamed protein product [Adineta ricciae]CAF1301648.1 unnamed protein product [Adineta ricciae]
MLRISNKKIAGFEGRWASFPGFTILFDNPGENYLKPRSSKIFDLHNKLHVDSALHFYKILDEGMARLDVNRGATVTITGFSGKTA